MSALGDSAYFTLDDFTNFSNKALSQFDQLINAGATERQALMMLEPQLQNLIKYADAYNLTLDDQTKSLIEQARNEGILHEQRNIHQETPESRESCALSVSYLC